MLQKQAQVLSEVTQDRNFKRNSVLNGENHDDDTDTVLFFKLKNIKLKNLISEVFQHRLPEAITTSLYIKLNIYTFQTLFSVYYY